LFYRRFRFWIENSGWCVVDLSFYVNSVATLDFYYSWLHGGTRSFANFEIKKVMLFFVLRFQFRIEKGRGVRRSEAILSAFICVDLRFPIIWQEERIGCIGAQMLICPSLWTMWFFKIVGCIGEREASPTLKLKKSCYFLFYGFSLGLKREGECAAVRRYYRRSSALICGFRLPGSRKELDVSALKC